MDIREGGGGLVAFGLPFLAAGLFVVFGSVGLVPIDTGADGAGRPGLFLLGAGFALIGAVIAFGRRVTSLDLAEHAAVTQWRVLLPVRSWRYELGDFRAVTITFVRGDSDSADQYRVGLKARSGPPLVLCRPTAYALACDCAAAAARHLGFDIEDSSTGHATRMAAGEMDASVGQRLRARLEGQPSPVRPQEMRSEVDDTGAGVRIVVPMPRLHPLVIAGALVPAVVAMSMLAWLGIFSQSRALTPIEWIFFGLLFLGFAVMPVAHAASLWLRSRVGHTIVSVSTEGVRVEERTAFRTRTIARLDAREILDVDCSTKDSMIASARRDVEQQSSTMRNGTTVSPAADAVSGRVFALLGAFLTGKGVIVKSRQGLTTFGEGLADDEIRYLHGVVERALGGRTIS
jgi:hypothetical protein